ncbi:MAG: SUMF1/EgtB/PvdO family nonheme iron enzyme [Spirochaetes bacterium]|nr:SUMF1/EgtB/PvdO family nonheme iron enzyme [Spirochaetota bacterium]
MQSLTLRSFFIIPLAIFLANCSSAKVKTTSASAANDFSFTSSDLNDCKNIDARHLCLEAKAIDRELAVDAAPAVSNNVLIEAAVVTNADYARCVADLQCDANSYYKPGDSRANAASPALGLNIEATLRYCAWAGGRLPTLAELKAGAAHTDFQKSAFAEWSNSWQLSPGASCTVKNKNICEPANPLGICSGVFPCDKSLKLKKTFNPNTNETAAIAYATKTQLAFRCASDNNPPTQAPPWMLKNPPAPLGDPGPLSAKERELLQNLEATDTLNKPICKAKYTSPAHCKDPVTYFTPNESQNYFFAPYIRNLGGGYAGVAADANYSYIALAKSRFVWLFDFDVNINALHRIIRAFVVESPSVADFLAKFEKRNSKAALDILAKYYSERSDLDFIQQVYRNNAPNLLKHYRMSARADAKQGDFGWLRHAENYRYIRLLYTQDRIAIVPGDMLKDKSMRSIGKAAKALGVPIRVYYPSNAEEFWDYSTNDANYKRNVLSLPFDEASITFRSVHEYPWHPAWRKGFKGFWHYVVHGAYNYQKKLLLPHYDFMDYFKMYRVVSKERADFSTIEIPAAIPKGILEQDR